MTRPITTATVAGLALLSIFSACHAGLEVKRRAYPPSLLEEATTTGLLLESDEEQESRLAEHLLALFDDAPAAKPDATRPTKFQLDERSQVIDSVTARRFRFAMWVPNADTTGNEELRARARVRLTHLLPGALARLLSPKDRPGPLDHAAVADFVARTGFAVIGRVFQSVELWDDPFRSLEQQAVLEAELPEEAVSLAVFWAAPPEVYRTNAPRGYDPARSDAVEPAPPPELFDAWVEDLVADYLELPEDAPEALSALGAWVLETRRPMLERLAAERVLRSLLAFQMRHREDPLIARLRLDGALDPSRELFIGAEPIARIAAADVIAERFTLSPGLVHGITPLVRPGGEAWGAVGVGVRRVHVTFPFRVNYRRAWDRLFTLPAPRLLPVDALWQAVLARAAQTADHRAGRVVVDAMALDAAPGSDPRARRGFDHAREAEAAVAGFARWMMEPSAREPFAAALRAHLEARQRERWRQDDDPWTAPLVSRVGADLWSLPSVGAPLLAALDAEVLRLTPLELQATASGTILSVEFRFSIPDPTPAALGVLQRRADRLALEALLARNQGDISAEDAPLLFALAQNLAATSESLATYVVECEDRALFDHPFLRPWTRAQGSGVVEWGEHPDIEIQLLWEADAPMADAALNGDLSVAGHDGVTVFATRAPENPKQRLNLVLIGDSRVLAPFNREGVRLTLRVTPRGGRGADFTGVLRSVLGKSAPIGRNASALEQRWYRLSCTVAPEFPFPMLLGIAAEAWRRREAPQHPARWRVWRAPASSEPR